MGEDDETRRTRLRIAPGQREVPLVALKTYRLVAPGLMLEIGDLGPHQRTVNAVQIQQSQALVVAALFEIAVEKDRTEIGPLADIEVHQKKGDLAHDVDAGQRGIEFDAVEDHDFPAHRHHVGQVQVPVAVPYSPVSFAPLDEVMMPFELGLGPGAEGCQLLAARDLRRTVPDLCEVFQGILANLGGAPIGRVGRGALGPSVKLSDRSRERLDAPRRELSAREHPVELCRAGKAAHLDAVFDGGAWTPQAGAIRRPGYGHDRQIQLGGEARVEPELFLAIEPALLERREVQKPEIDGLLEFIRERAGQEHTGDVGLDHLEVFDRMTEGLGCREAFNQPPQPSWIAPDRRGHARKSTARCVADRDGGAHHRDHDEAHQCPPGDRQTEQAPADLRALTAPMEDFGQDVPERIGL